MSWASITYTFSPSTTIKSSDVNTNFSNVVTGLNTAAPSGIIVMWSGAIGSIPTGWYLCDGTNGTPDLRGRFIVAAGQGAGLTNRVVGATGGEESHVLSIGELPSHDHGGTTGVDSPDHAHSVPNSNGTSNSLNGGAIGSYTGYMQSGTGANTYGATARHAHSITAQGSGTAHNTMPPFYALALIMKS